MGSKIYQYDDVEFWAEGGVVYILDKTRADKLTNWKEASEEERVRTFKGLPPKEFLKRALAVGILDLKKYENYPKDLKKVRQFLENAREVYKLARKQGAIDDPQASEFKSRHNLFIPPQILVPNIPWENKDSRTILLKGLFVNYPLKGGACEE